MADRSQQTEQPTERRLDKARKEGQFPAARELVAALQFLVFVLLLASGTGIWFRDYAVQTRRLLGRAFAPTLTPGELTGLVVSLAWQNLAPLTAVGLVLATATLGIRLVTTRFGFALKKLTPDLARLNPLARLRELPGQNLPALVEAVVLLPVFCWAVYGVARDNLAVYLALPLGSVHAGVALIASSLTGLLWKAAGLFLAFGLVDLLRQYRRYRRDLRMSKQEIRDEIKEAEGNPQIKARVRRIQRDRARRQMMKEVPHATAVVVNPHRYAVALRYHMESMAAPVVVAKGRNWLALRIRQKALEHLVPIIENPPLARALYEAADVGQEIPAHLYRAVAEVLAYVFKLIGGKLPG